MRGYLFHLKPLLLKHSEKLPDRSIEQLQKLLRKQPGPIRTKNPSSFITTIASLHMKFSLLTLNTEFMYKTYFLLTPINLPPSA